VSAVLPPAGLLGAGSFELRENAIFVIFSVPYFEKQRKIDYATHH
jgi:hypothetical protein